MSASYTPAQVCAIVLAAAGYHLNVATLRQWRHRNFLLGYSQDGDAAPTRYSLAQVFHVCVMAQAIRSGYTIRTAANLAMVARAYAPGSRGRVNDPSDYLLIFPAVFSGENDDDASPTRAFLHSVTRAEEVFTSSEGTGWVLTVSQLRRKVIAAAAELDAV